MTEKTGIESYYVIKNNKKLRFGYTTGSCAAGAAKAAVRKLLFGEWKTAEELMTPKGILLHLEITEKKQDEIWTSCAVRKDGGDDPDVTDKMLIFAAVRKQKKPGISIDGGEGIGRVTKPGLDQPVGNAAINKTPRAMILREAGQLLEQSDYSGGLEIVIYAPEGRERACKTFNPRLGIEGGISILGTSGIVEPMSEAALVASIEVEMRQRLALGRNYLLVTPGNYGADYLREHMQLPFEENIKCSNYVGETVDMAVRMQAKGILFVAHIGKFVKVAAGIMNTHSHSADARMEVLASNGIICGLSLEGAKKILKSNTTDEALAVLEQEGILKETMGEILKKIQFYLDHRSYEQILLGAVIFSNVYGYLGQTENAVRLIEEIQKEQE